jgi:asparagine synthase (glutamine-hydrolysing)
MTLERMTHTPELPGRDVSGRAILPEPREGRSWLVWLGHRPDATPDPAGTGLGPDQHAYPLGRCLLTLPNDGHPFSCARSHGRTAFLFGHLLHQEDLRRRLELPPDPPPSDADLLLAAYNAWGTQAPQQLDGAFAAVLWDETRDQLLCFRDAIGLMPCFYARTPAGLVLSSDLWTVLRHPHVSRQVDPLAVALHLTWNHDRTEETLFQQVRRLPGAHCLQVRGQQVTVERYWDPLPPPGEPIDWVDREELGQFPTLMEEVIASYLELGPTAISLSAGIDSVSVAYFAVEAAARLGREKPEAFSIHFADPTCDESGGQAAVAEALGMKFRLLTFAECLGGQPLLEAALQLTPASPTPMLSLWQPLYRHLMAEARRQGARTVLTGNGGDEQLCVMHLVAADLIRSGDLVGLWGAYRADRRSHGASHGYLIKQMLWENGVRPVLRDLAFRYAPGWAERQRRPVELPDWIAPDPHLRRQLLDRLQPPTPSLPEESYYVREMRTALQHPLAMIDMEQFHYRGYGRGISYLHPYWSRPVIEFLFRTPPRLLNEGGFSKGFVRRILAERFPHLGFDRQRKVYATSMSEPLIDAQWPALWQRWAPDSALERAGVVDVARLAAAMQTASRRQRCYILLWLATEAWLRGQ